MQCSPLAFAFIPIYLHPDYQDDNDYNYLGLQKVDGHQCLVIAFAETAATPHLSVKLTDGPFSYKVYLQGLVWIDSSSFQIIRIYTELLPDAVLKGIKQQTTEVTFAGIHFKGIEVALWLPREVVVNTDWAGKKYRNYHRYSDYKLFRSKTKLIY